MVKSLFILLFVFSLIGCSKTTSMDCDNPDYSECITTEPDFWELKIIVTKVEKTSKVPIVLFKGKFGSTSEVIYSDTVEQVETTIYLPLNQDYYATATYEKDGKTIYAVDGVYFEKKSKQVCDSVCWSVKHGEIDIRLKN